MTWQDKVVFVTGASAGIGEAVAREAVAQGARVVLAARRKGRVEALARELGDDRALGVACDVTRDGELEAAVERARVFGPLDAMIANAGFGVGGRFEKLTLDDYRRQFETNVFGVVRSVQAALPDLRATRGAVGIVGSANGYVSIPGWSAYCMSKHAVRSFAECIRHELSREGISVTHLAPGFVESEFRRVDNQSALREELEDPIPRWLRMPAAKAAKKILAAVAARVPEAVITGHAKIAVSASRHAPRLVSAALGVGRHVVSDLSKRA
ncbi:MAG TPA: SDR family NAD(P)-dependent oxidoreductase [Polyangiaceae bacterium]